MSLDDLKMADYEGFKVKNLTILLARLFRSI